MARTDARSNPADLARIEPGWEVCAADGSSVGRVRQIQRDYLIIERGLLDPSERYIPVSAIAGLSNRRVELGLTTEDLGNPHWRSRPADLDVAGGRASPPAPRTDPDESRRLELREERLEARTSVEEAGRIGIGKEVETVPRRLDAESFHEEAIVEHVPVGRVVEQRQPARDEAGTYVIPIYEEQLVLVKRLVLKEEIRVRRQRVTERHRYDETVERERLVIDDPERTGRVRERYATEQPAGERVAGDSLDPERRASDERPDFWSRLGRSFLR